MDRARAFVAAEGIGLDRFRLLPTVCWLGTSDAVLRALCLGGVALAALLVIGILPVLPGVFESRHEVVAVAKRAAQMAQAKTGSGIYVDQQHANAYPQSLLFGQ